MVCRALHICAALEPSAAAAGAACCKRCVTAAAICMQLSDLVPTLFLLQFWGVLVEASSRLSWSPGLRPSYSASSSMWGLKTTATTQASLFAPCPT